MRDLPVHEILEGNNQDVDSELEAKRKLRDFSEETWFYWVRVIALCLISLCGFAIVGTYILHLIFPEKWHWVTPSQLSSLKDLAITILTGAVISQATTYFLGKR